MGELVFMQNDQALTNSLLVAEKFRKEHYHVLEVLRDLIAKIGNSGFVENQQINNMFALVEQEVPMPVGDGMKKSPMYIMNRDGFILLVMGFTGEKALRFKLEFIAAFNRMEKQLKQPLLPEVQMQHLEEIISLKDEIIRDKDRIISQAEHIMAQNEKINALNARIGELSYPMQPVVTVIDEKASIVGRSTRRRALLTEYENLERFAEVFFRNENNFAHPVSKNEMMHLYIKFCGLEPSKAKMKGINQFFNQSVREYCQNAGIVVNPAAIFSSASDCREGYIRRPAYETEYKFGVPTVPEQRLLNKVCRCYYFYSKDNVPDTPKALLPATGKEALL